MDGLRFGNPTISWGLAQCWDETGRAGKAGVDPTWCPGPDSNRHGVAPEGFSYPLRLSPLRAAANNGRIWGLDFTFTMPRSVYRVV